MDQLQNAIVEDFGSGYVKFGHSELLGRVVGLLLCTDTPLTEEQISQELHVSKSPINQITRRLEQLNLVRRVRLQGDRKFYYQVSSDLFLQAGINLSRLYEDNLRIAETHLQVVLEKYRTAEAEERAKLGIIAERLIKMREFHLRQVQSYERFIGEWRTAKMNLPTVEEYAERLQVSAA
ncbi:MAG: GbsR/MarR family transcriptional regulator [bacterium]